MKNKSSIIKKRWILLACGLASILFGVTVYMNLPAGEPDLSMLMGMFSGVGAAFLAVSARGFFLNAMMTPEQKRQSEIDSKDERNILISRKAYVVSNVVTGAFFAVSSFILVGLGNRVAAYFCIGGMYLQIFSQALAQIYYKKKM